MKKALKNILIITLSLLVVLPSLTAGAASSINISYNGRTYTYKDKLVQVSLNGSKINLGTTPGILVGGIALVSYDDVLTKSAIGAVCKYSSSSKAITITRGTTIIKMTLNSKIAYVNDKKYTLSAAPLQVTYKSSGKTKILIPARFVAERMGFNYTWNSNTSTISILTKGLNLEYDGKWNTYKGTKGKVTFDGKKINVSELPSIIINNTALIQGKKVFKESLGVGYSYDSKAKVLTLKKDNTTIKLTMGSKIAYVNGKKSTMGTAARLVTLKSTGDSYVMVPGEFVATNLGYNYFWDNSKATSVITSAVTSIDNDTDIDETDNVVATGEFFNWPLHIDYVDNYTKIVNLLDSTRIVANSSNNIISAEYTEEGTNVSNDSEQIDNINNIDNLENINNLNNSSNNEGIPLDVSIITSIVKSETTESSEVYTITSDLPMSVITATNETDNSLVMNIDNAIWDGSLQTYETGIVKLITSSNIDNNLRLEFSLNISKVKYQAVLSEDNRTLTVIIYNNYISSISAGSEAGEDYISITGIFTPDVIITEDDENIYVDIPHTINGVGAQTAITNAMYIKTVISTNLTSDSTRLIIGKANPIGYSITQDNTSINIVFSDVNDIDNSFVLSDFNVKFLKPNGVMYSSITEKDLYLEKKYKVIIPGDYVNFYMNNPVSYSTNAISDISVILNYNGDTEITFKTNGIKGFKLGENDKYFVIKVGTPKEIYKNIVVLDPGHGGGAPGAIYSGIKEKDINFKVLYTYAKNYFESNADIKVFYTRTADNDVSLYDRVDFAKIVEADLFISLHNNSATATAKGTEVWYSTDNNKTLSNGLNSKIVAKKFVDGLSSTLGMTNRGIKSGALVVTKKNTVPAVLIELAFMTNSSDMSKLKDDAYLRKSAKTIYDITCQIFDSYPTGR